MALPFLPAEKIERRFNHLQRRATTEALKTFSQYVNDNWIISRTFPPATWSVYMEAVRTNNDLEAGFSPNFSSAGKGPFMDGKAKRYTLFSGGGGGRGVGEWREGHGPRPPWEIFLFPYFKTYFTQICCRVIFRQQIKTFDSNNFTMSLMSSFQNACP